MQLFYSDTWCVYRHRIPHAQVVLEDSYEKEIYITDGDVSDSTNDYLMTSYLKDFAKIHRNSCKRTGFKCIINSI